MYCGYLIIVLADQHYYNSYYFQLIVISGSLLSGSLSCDLSSMPGYRCFSVYSPVLEDRGISYDSLFANLYLTLQSLVVDER